MHADKIQQEYKLPDYDKNIDQMVKFNIDYKNV